MRKIFPLLRYFIKKKRKEFEEKISTNKKPRALCSRFFVRILYNPAGSVEVAAEAASNRFLASEVVGSNDFVTAL